MPSVFAPLSRIVVSAALLVGLAALTACAGDDGAGWAKPGGDSAQRAADSRVCKREADDYALRRTHQPDRLDLGARDSFGVNPMAQVDRSEARDAYRRYYASCMQGRGYTRASR